MILLGFVPSTFTAARKGALIVPAVAPVQAQDGPPLHYKSRLGLMPPAYGAAESERGGVSALASGLFGSYSVYQSSSWPEAVASGEWTDDAQTDATLSTSFDSDPANDRQVHLFAGGSLSRVAQLAAGSGAIDLARGDFNRDGLHDLAVVNQDDHTLGIFFQSAPGVRTP